VRACVRVIQANANGQVAKCAFSRMTGARTLRHPSNSSHKEMARDRMKNDAERERERVQDNEAQTRPP
jgi:hypothetical protein